jgi:hypothetical protein
MNIFDIQKSKQDKDFVKKNGNVELEVFVDIVETCKDIPLVGSMLKLGKVAINYMEWRYINKLSKFLESSNDLEEDVVNKYILSLTQKDYDRISNFLKHLLYTSEEDEKARVMGMIYKARLLNKIDDNMMLRLCSIINNSFLFDLKKIPLYIKETNFYSLEASNFINWGLIDNYMGGSWLNDASYELNEVGLVLHEILDTENWFDN